MIEINKGRLLLDRKEISAKIKYVKNKSSYSIKIIDLAVAQQILNYKYAELPKVYYLDIPVEIEWSKVIERVLIYTLRQNTFEIKFRFSTSLEKWGDKDFYFRYYGNFTVAVSEFNSNYLPIIEGTKIGNILIRINSFQNSAIGFEVVFITNDLSLNLKEEIYKFVEILHIFHKEALEKNKIHEESGKISGEFSFPEELKIPCEQYLLYFAQFLQDLGINATSNLKEEAGKVLFSVTPTDDVEALDKIREALAVYLKLPESPIVYDESFAAMRLQQQVENLQHSQRMAVRELQFNEKLLIAQSDTIREKNITISQQQTVIENQSKIIDKISSKSIMMDSVENKEELEEICEGLKVGKSKFLAEQLGIHLNPATFAKNIGKRILGKPEHTSILEPEETENN